MFDYGKKFDGTLYKFNKYKFNKYKVKKEKENAEVGTLLIVMGIILICLFVLFFIFFGVVEKEKVLKIIQDGKVRTFCYIDKGYKYIEPSKIVDIDYGDETVVIFNNGSSTRCIFYNINKYSLFEISKLISIE